MKRLFPIAVLLFALQAAAEGVIVKPVDYQVFQRDARNMGVIPVKIDGASADAKVRVRVAAPGTSADWISLQRVGSSFEGSLTVPAGGWYTLEAEVRGKETTTLTVPRVGIGEVFLTYGQSNSCNFGQYRSTAENPLVAAMNPKTETWQPCKDPQPTVGGFGGTKGSCWPAAGDYLADRLKMPVAFVACGWGGASIAALAPGAKSHWYENRLRDAIRKLPPRGFRAVLFHQGETDAIQRTSVNRYASLLKKMIAQSRKDAGWDVPWIVANAAAHKQARQESEDAVVLAQQKTAAEDPLVWNGPYTDVMDMMDPVDAPKQPHPYRGDNIHFSKAGARIHGIWWSRILCRELLALPEFRVELTLGADRIRVGEPVAYSLKVYGRDGQLLKVPAELMVMYAKGVTVADGKLTLTELPRKGIRHLRLIAKAPVPGAKRDPSEKINPLTGYVLSEAVLLPIVR